MILIIYLLQSVYTNKIKIIGLKSIKQDFPFDINVALGNFGHIPYGHKIMDEIILASN